MNLCKRLLFLIVLVYTSNVLFSQDLVISVDKKGKIGFSTPDGQEVIAPKYSTAEPFVNGLSKVSINGMYGFIDVNGNEVLPLEYSAIHPFKHGVAIVEKKDKKGLINSDYKVIAEPIYNSVGKIGESDYIWLNLNGKKKKGSPVLYGGKRGIINKEGKVIVPVEKCSLRVYSDNKNIPIYINDTMDIPVKCDYFAYMSTSKSTGLEVIDKEGKVLLPENSYSFISAPSNGRIVFRHYGKNSIKQGFYDLNTGKEYVLFSYEGKVKNKTVVWGTDQFVNDRSLAKGDDLYFYVIDGEGKKLSNSYASIRSVHLGDKSYYIAAKNKGATECAILNHDGQEVTPLGTYTKMEVGNNITNFWVAAYKNGKWGILNENGEELMPFEYDGVSGFMFDRAKVRKGNLYGLYEYNKGLVIPCEYMDVKQATYADDIYFWVQKSDYLWYRFDKENNVLSEVGYKDVTNYKHNTAFVKPTNQSDYDKFVIFTKRDQSFIMIDQNDQVVMQSALSRFLLDQIWDKIIEYRQANNIDKFTPTQTRRMLLNLTQHLRAYPILLGKIDESQWDY